MAAAAAMAGPFLAFTFLAFARSETALGEP
jgi:hypothetical protein